MLFEKGNRDNAIRHLAGDILTDNHAMADVIRDACRQCEWVSERTALDIRIEPTDISRRQ